MKADIVLRVDCLTPERLIGRALSEGARFSAIRHPEPGVLLIECDAASARAIAALCRRFSIPVRVLRRRGTSALVAFARRRATLAVGLIAGLMLCALFLSRIWWVDIAFSGERAAQGDAAELRRALAAAGVYPGMPGDPDTALLTEALQAGNSGYSFIGCRVQGVRLLVEAVPEVPAPGVYDVDAARDLVSDRDGIVVRATARSGALCVQPGEVVRRGQLLIRGEEQSDRDETRPIAALGEVVVRAWYTGEASLPLWRREPERTGRAHTSVSLVGPGFEWPIASQGEAVSRGETETKRLPLGGLYFPLALCRSTLWETRESRSSDDREALKARLRALALADAALKLAQGEAANCEISDSWIDYREANGALHARAVCEIQVNAAVTRETLQGGQQTWKTTNRPTPST